MPRPEFDPAMQIVDLPREEASLSVSAANEAAGLGMEKALLELENLDLFPDSAESLARRTSLMKHLERLASCPALLPYVDFPAERIADILTSPGDFRDCCLSPDGRLLAVAESARNAESSTLHLIRLDIRKQDGSLIRPLKHEVPSVVDTVQFAPDGETLAVGGTSCVTSVYRVVMERDSAKLDFLCCASVIPGPTSNPARCSEMTFTSDGRLLATGGSGCPLHVYELVSAGHSRADLHHLLAVVHPAKGMHFSFAPGTHTLYGYSIAAAEVSKPFSIFRATFDLKHSGIETFYGLPNGTHDLKLPTFDHGCARLAAVAKEDRREFLKLYEITPAGGLNEICACELQETPIAMTFTPDNGSICVSFPNRGLVIFSIENEGANPVNATLHEHSRLETNISAKRVAFVPGKQQMILAGPFAASGGTRVAIVDPNPRSGQAEPEVACTPTAVEPTAVKTGGGFFGGLRRLFSSGS